MSKAKHAPEKRAVEQTPGVASVWGGRIVRGTLIVFGLMFVAFLAIHPLNSYDVWTHLAIGRLMWEEQRIPDHEPFSYTQNREMSLDEAAPLLVVRETIRLDTPRSLPEEPPYRIAAAAGTPFDNDLKTTLKRLNLLYDAVDVDGDVHDRRLAEDAMTADNTVVVRGGTVLKQRHVERCLSAGIDTVHVVKEDIRLKIEPPLKRLTADAVGSDGEVVLAEGTLLGEEEIDLLREAGVSSVHVTVPWVNHEWLFQIGAYLSYKWWGLSGPIFYKTAILMIGFTVMLIAVYRRETHVIGVFAVFLAAIVSHKRFFMRPEVFSILFTAVWLWVLEQFRRRPSWHICWVLPALMVVWINAHGYFILGVGVLLIYLLGESLQSVIPMPRVLRSKLRWKDDLIAGRSLKILGIATVLVIAATFVNPYGVDGARYPIDVLGQVADPTSVIRTVIGEMQPPWSFGHIEAVFYTWVLIYLSAASFLLNARRLKFSRLLLWVVSIIFLDKALRNMPFFGIPAGVIMTLNVNEAWDDTVRFVNERVIPEALIALKWLSQAALAGLLIFYLLTIPSDRFYVADGGSVRFGLGYTDQKFSMGSVEWIRNSGVKGHIFNAFGMGGLCMWKFYPEERDGELHYGGRQLFIDGRAEVYGGPFVKNYTSSLGGEERSIALWRGFDERFRFHVVFLNWYAGNTHPILRRLYYDPEWMLCYGDGSGYVFVRRPLKGRPIKGPEDAAILKHNLAIIRKLWGKDISRGYIGEPGNLWAKDAIEKDTPSPTALWHNRPLTAKDVRPGETRREAWRRRRQALRRDGTLGTMQDPNRSLREKLLCADPYGAAMALKASDSPTVVQFKREDFTNGYDRVREWLPILPRRAISPGTMVGRAQFALSMSGLNMAEFLPDAHPQKIQLQEQPDLFVLGTAIVDGLRQIQDDIPDFYVHRATFYQQLAKRKLKAAARNTAGLPKELRDVLARSGHSDLEKARTCLLEARAINPNYRGVTLMLLRLAQDRGDGRAVARYLVQLRKRYRSLSITSAVAGACMSQKLNREALQYLQHGLTLLSQRDRTDWHRRISECHARLGEWPQALKHAQTAVDLLGGHDGALAAAAWCQLGTVHFQRRGSGRRLNRANLNNALIALGRCVAIRGQDLERTHMNAWQRIALCREGIGDIEWAVAAWEAFLVLKPGDKNVQKKIDALQKELRERKSTPQPPTKPAKSISVLPPASARAAPRVPGA